MKKNIGTEKDNSIVALHELLQEISTSPDNFVGNQALFTALRSQGETAKMSFAEKGIVGTSINTVKRHADRWIPGGFAALDSARILALEKLEGAKELQARARRRTKQALTDEVRGMKQTVGQADIDKKLLTGALGEAITLMREYAGKTKDGAIVAQCEKEIREILQNFSLKRQAIFTAESSEDNGAKS